MPISSARAMLYRPQNLKKPRSSLLKRRGYCWIPSTLAKPPRACSHTAAKAGSSRMKECCSGTPEECLRCCKSREHRVLNAASCVVCGTSARSQYCSAVPPSRALAIDVMDKSSSTRKPRSWYSSTCCLQRSYGTPRQSRILFLSRKEFPQ